MNRHSKNLTFEVPRHPEPQTFRVDRERDLFELNQLRMDPDGYRHALKNEIARNLAAHIVANTQFVDVSDISARNPRVSVEISFNDRGTYENWLPQERKKGEQEGAKLVRDALPYGFDPSEVYE
jgi:hypothetical protein